MDFFGDSSGAGPIVARIKKLAPPRPPVLSNGGSRPGSSSSTPKAQTGVTKLKSTNGQNGHRLPEKRPNGSSSSSSHPQKKLKPSQSVKLSSMDRKSSSRTPRSDRSDSESSEDIFDEPRRSRLSTAQPTEEDTKRTYGPERQWCFDKVDERGEWGRGWAGFVPPEEVVRGQRRGWKGSWQARGVGLEMYVPWFLQEGFENKEPLPSVDLVYPSGCRETFILLASNKRGEYAPISELRSALTLILNHYIPPSHQHIFGTINDSWEMDKPPTPSMSTFASPAPNGESTPAPDGEPQAVHETIGNALRKSMAPNRRDGPGFTKAMERFNEAMQGIISDGSLAKWMEVRPRLDKEEWSALVDGVHDEAYSRVVGPYANELEHHPKHPDEVAKAITAKEDSYGELRHKFMSRVIEQTKLGPNSVFVDLGSGVGNCVLQAALEAGCRSYGFELLPVPAHCARLQLREVQRRWAMWGLHGNTDVGVYEGDFRDLPEVPKRLREADVVLVNNEVFPSALNDELKSHFLELKDGAIIVSLQPFVSQSFKMNEQNCDSFDAIVKLSQHRYYNEWVSWKADSGNYYLQVVDRSMRRKFEEDLSGRRKRA